MKRQSSNALGVIPAAPVGERLRDLITRIDEIRSREGPGRLIEVLGERESIYDGLSSNEVERLRGYLLLCLAEPAIPDAAIPYVLEELALGVSPYSLAAAARAVCSARALPAEVDQLLAKAVERIRGHDDWVSLSTPVPSRDPAELTTPVTELVRALGAVGGEPAAEQLRAWLTDGPNAFSDRVRAEMERGLANLAESTSPHAQCCSVSGQTALRQPGETPLTGGRGVVTDLPVEDQDGNVLTFGDAAFGHPTALAFFYTRCMNPNKCSQTVHKMAELRRDLVTLDLGERVNVFGMTYDPAFDTPPRLKSYGEDRGMRFGDNCRLLRTVGSFEPFQEWLDLGVSYGPVTVNRHRLDLVILDADGDIAASFVREPWDVDTVSRGLEALAGRL